MNSKFAPLLKTFGAAALALVTLQIVIVSVMRYVTLNAAAPPPILGNAFADPFLLLHVLSAVVGLTVGPLQFVSAIRARWPWLHRASGRVYVAACALATPTGLVLALGTTAGPIAGAGFAILGLLWGGFTWMGVRAVLSRRIAEHREWVLRSYAMAAAAITLRLMIPAAFVLGLDFSTAYPVIAWACWLSNLALVEYWIRRRRTVASPSAELATA